MARTLAPYPVPPYPSVPRRMLVVMPDRELGQFLAMLADDTRRWDARDFDAPFWLETVLRSDQPDVAAHLVTEFCRTSGSLPSRFGVDATGRMIWYLMGAGRQVWHDVARAARDAAAEAVLSLKGLYDKLFAAYLTGPRDGTPGVSHPLGCACYMLWDMDGGLSSIPIFKKPKWLIDPCFDVLDHALSANSAACRLSALHGLGHIVAYDPRAGVLINSFLERTKGALSMELLEYAGAARSGMVQ